MKERTPDPEHLRFAVLAADAAIFTLRDGTLLVRMTKIDRPPHYPGDKGLPGGLIHPKETAEEAVVRLGAEKAGINLSKSHVEQLYTFSKIDRDPRGRVVAVGYLALIPWENLSTGERADTSEHWWADPRGLHGLAYDHDEMLHTALTRLRSRITYTTLISKLMPKEFTLTELEKTYETLLGEDLDKRNFRKKILKLKILKTLPHKKSSGPFRPAQLYGFASSTISNIEVF
jgi:8-oxo-dGTP diphosphatase